MMSIEHGFLNWKTKSGLLDITKTNIFTNFINSNFVSFRMRRRIRGKQQSNY